MRTLPFTESLERLAKVNVAFAKQPAFTVKAEVSNIVTARKSLKSSGFDSSLEQGEVLTPVGIALIGSTLRFLFSSAWSEENDVYYAPSFLDTRKLFPDLIETLVDEAGFSLLSLTAEIEGKVNAKPALKEAVRDALARQTLTEVAEIVQEKASEDRDAFYDNDPDWGIF